MREGGGEGRGEVRGGGRGEERRGEYDITTRVQECLFLVGGEDSWFAVLVKRFHTRKQAITYLFNPVYSRPTIKQHSHPLCCCIKAYLIYQLHAL